MHQSPPRHFRPLTYRQRAELLKKIDATELEALGTEQGLPVSEGTASAQRLTDSKPPLTDDRFLLRPDSLPTHRVHLVQAIKPAHACTPLSCMGDPACPDHHCEGHPRNAARADERCTCTPETKCAQHQHQGALFTKVTLGYGVVLFLAALATWQWLSR